MKLTVCFLSILGFTLALLSSHNGTPQYLIPNTLDDIIQSDPPGSRIVGGHEVEPNSVPYQVAVIINSLGVCGGSLISTTRVLTAAHCTLTASFVKVVLGAHNINIVEAKQVRVTSTNIINHENYFTIENDISIVLLPTPVTLNNAIQTIPLAPASASSFEGSSAYVTGWGLTSDSSGLSPVLRGAVVPIMSNAECTRLFGNIIRDSHICTAVTESGGACSSDSGGPLVVDGVQVGLVVFGSGNCNSQTVNGFARVSYYRSWIQTHAGV